MKIDQLASSASTQFYVHHASSDKTNHGIIGLSENQTIAYLHATQRLER